jgi:hypothetical protein
LAQPTSLRDRTLIYLGILLVALQFVTITFISITTAVNIPYEDDYDGILGFLRQYAALHSRSARAFWVLTAQHTNYKLVLLHSLVAAQYSVRGHVNLTILALLGDASLLAAAVLLWFFVRRAIDGPLQRVWLYVPVCLLFLSPVYWPNIGWALCAVQNLSIIMFALATFLCLAYRGRIPAALLLISALFSVAASGNGFFVALIAAAVLLFQRRFRLAAAVFALTLALGLIYAINYHSIVIGPPLNLHRTVAALVLIPFALLGSAAVYPIPAILLGLAFVAIFLRLSARGWPKADPASFAGALFCVVTALGVGVSRHRFGWAAGLSDRYRMYSVLLAALEILGLFTMSRSPRATHTQHEDAGVRSAQPLSRNRAVLATLAAAIVLYGVYADRVAYRALTSRKALLTIHLIEWQRSPTSLIVVPDEAPHMKLPNWVEARSIYQAEFAKDVALGLYIPPTKATDPLPPMPAFLP